MNRIKKAAPIWTTLVANTGVAVIFAIAISFYSPRLSWWDMLRVFETAWVYANCIGIPASAIPWRHISLCRLSPPVTWLIWIGVMLGVGALGSLAACGMFVVLGWLAPGEFWAYYRASVKMAIMVTLIIGTAITIYESMRARLEETTLQLRTKELERERALKLATEAQLASLESRLHPHFLFNTLNSISSLIREDPKKAEQLVAQMAGLLRFSLETGQSGAVPLERELQIVRDYLDIEKTRLGDRLNYRISAAPGTEGASVPPLSIQTLVENSIKHAIAPNRAGGTLDVLVEHVHGQLRVRVSDSGPGFSVEEAPAGHGIENLRSRFTALYGPGASLQTNQNGSGACVEFAIPYAEAASARI